MVFGGNSGLDPSVAEMRRVLSPPPSVVPFIALYRYHAFIPRFIGTAAAVSASALHFEILGVRSGELFVVAN